MCVYAVGADCKRLEDAGVDRIQFDVMDGNFVPNLTFGPELIAACRKYTKVPFETQLMVSNYNCDTMLDQYTDATKGGEPTDGHNTGVVIVHVEGNVHLHRALTKIREAGGSPSVALNPHTPAEMIENVLDLVDHVLVMTVNPGFGGQAYIPTMTEKIRKIRKWIVDRGLDIDIEVDGGVKADWTIAECADAGANWYASASASKATACTGSPSLLLLQRLYFTVVYACLVVVLAASSPARACSRTTTSPRAARRCATSRSPRRRATSRPARRRLFLGRPALLRLSSVLTPPRRAGRGCDYGQHLAVDQPFAQGVCVCATH